MKKIQKPCAESSKTSASGYNKLSQSLQHKMYVFQGIETQRHPKSHLQKTIRLVAMDKVYDPLRSCYRGMNDDVFVSVQVSPNAAFTLLYP